MNGRHSRRIRTRDRASFNAAKGVLQSRDGRIAVPGVDITRLFTRKDLIDFCHRVISKSRRGIDRRRYGLGRQLPFSLALVNEQSCDVEILFLVSHLYWFERSDWG